MKSNFFQKLLCLLLLLLLPQFVVAQSVSGNDGLRTSREYRKVSSDSLRLRKSKTVKKAKKNGKGNTAKPDNSSVKKQKRTKARKSKAVKQKDTLAVKSRKSGVRIDSVKYAPIEYSLGDRVIMRGDSGKDVRTVANILVKKLYLDEDSIIYTQGGGVLYDGELYRSVILFQRYNGFYEDGIIGRDLIKALRKRK